MKKANKYLAQVYMPAHNAEFAVLPEEANSMFVRWAGNQLEDILCEYCERRVGNDNCVKFDGLVLQIPSDTYRYHYVRVKVQVHRYPNGQLAIFHGPRKLATYDIRVKKIPHRQQKAA